MSTQPCLFWGNFTWFECLRCSASDASLGTHPEMWQLFPLHLPQGCTARNQPEHLPLLHSAHAVSCLHPPLTQPFCIIHLLLAVHLTSQSTPAWASGTWDGVLRNRWRTPSSGPSRSPYKSSQDKSTAVTFQFSLLKKITDKASSSAYSSFFSFKYAKCFKISLQVSFETKKWYGSVVNVAKAHFSMNSINQISLHHVYTMGR